MDDLPLNKDVRSIIKEYADGWYCYDSSSDFCSSIVPRKNIEAVFQAEFPVEDDCICSISIAQDKAINHMKLSYWLMNGPATSGPDGYIEVHNERDDDVALVLEGIVHIVSQLPKIYKKISIHETLTWEEMNVVYNILCSTDSVCTCKILSDTVFKYG